MILAQSVHIYNGRKEGQIVFYCRFSLKVVIADDIVAMVMNGVMTTTFTH